MIFIGMVMLPILRCVYWLHQIKDSVPSPSIYFWFSCAPKHQKAQSRPDQSWRRVRPRGAGWSASRWTGPSPRSSAGSTPPLAPTCGAKNYVEIEKKNIWAVIWTQRDLRPFRHNKKTNIPLKKSTKKRDVFAVLTSWFSPGDRPPPAACPSDRFQASLSACPSAAGSQSTGLQVIVYCLVFSVQDFVFSHVRFKQIIWVNENHLLPAVVAWSPFRFLYFPM